MGEVFHTHLLGMVFFMKFKKGDIVVITGVKKGDVKKLEVLADLYNVLHVGSHDLLVIPRTKYTREPFKISKHRCINVIDHALATIGKHPDSPKPKHGSLVLGFDTDYDGSIKKQVVGHVAQIIHNTNSRTYYVVSSDNKQIMFEENKVLLLE